MYWEPYKWAWFCCSFIVYLEQILVQVRILLEEIFYEISSIAIILKLSDAEVSSYTVYDFDHFALILHVKL